MDWKKQLKKVRFKVPKVRKEKPIPHWEIKKVASTVRRRRWIESI